MVQAKRRSFTINATDNAQLLDRLLQVNGHTRDSFASYMAVEGSELDTAPQWAINYLSDLLHAELIHLGYVAKDAKHEGVFGEYDEAADAYKELQNQRGDLQQPVIIDRTYIVSPVRTLKISILANATRMTNDYLSTLPPQETA